MELLKLTERTVALLACAVATLLLSKVLHPLTAFTQAVKTSSCLCRQRDLCAIARFVFGIFG